jgi:hypothetical protein
MNPILVAAEKERDRLNAEIVAIRARLAEIDVFLRTYDSLAAQLDLGPVRDRQPTPGANLRLIARPPTIKETVLEKCAMLLTDSQPRHTRDLLNALAIMNVPLRGKDPILQISKILSCDPRFVADRSKGWTLATQKAEGSDVGASEHSSSRREPLVATVEGQSRPVGKPQAKGVS